MALINSKNDAGEHIFILGYYGWKNTGDDAMLYSLLNILDKIYPSSIFTITTGSKIKLPESLEKRITEVDPNQHLSFFKALFQSSIYVLGGGTHFFDYGTRRIRIPRLLQHLLITGIMKLRRKKCYFLGIGVEKPNKWWGKLLIKNTCKLADLIVVRDSLSEEALQDMGVGTKTCQSFDLSLLLVEDGLNRGPSTRSGDIKSRPYSNKEDESITESPVTMGVSILPFYHIYDPQNEKDDLLVEKIASALNKWMADSHLHHLKLFIFNGQPPHDDIHITNSLFELLDFKNRVKIIPYNPDPLDILNEISTCSSFIGMRYHSCLFAFINHLPLLIIDYAPKNRALARDVGLNSKACISLEEVLSGVMDEKIQEIQLHPPDFQPSLKFVDAQKKALNWLRVL
ncbi:MAG: polysaccharide pyruvyl transferase family protein [Euryarchaeota archaeon]|nr:polysaccharide pyruvyl transferase family protein [Euryarchaeota archaeon]MBU4607879.1 polysaccharide pyruvyl transferase family protein [Euryarchaeota archaeon]MBV1730095.1 polysaccharide pyruvyl transferase family protein [Methanobacterium sp.]MBV1756059.1 polysaccharide pyruvyl transferase family protein [Methanobacterium sp.]